MRKRIIVDCDNTMGINGCDVDDGLALLYLLGKEDIEIRGITTTYGNSSVDIVFNNTKQMLMELGREDIELFKGCPDRFTWYSDAADFLVESVNAFEGQISILATGALTNLLAAYAKDKSFFDKVLDIVLMGGITEPLIINGKELSELNFSCDPTALELVISKGKNVSIITGNSCLKTFFAKEEFHKRLEKSDNLVAKYISQKCQYWFDEMMQEYDIDGFYNWDVVAAVYLVEPYLFRDNYVAVNLSPEYLNKGFLTDRPMEEPAGKMPVTINMPLVMNLKDFSNDVYSSWLNVK
jgi:purine nucleosidase